jgi:hypothetical protein
MAKEEFDEMLMRYRLTLEAPIGGDLDDGFMPFLNSDAEKAMKSAEGLLEDGYERTSVTRVAHARAAEIEPEDWAQISPTVNVTRDTTGRFEYEDAFGKRLSRRAAVARLGESNFF